MEPSHRPATTNYESFSSSLHQSSRYKFTPRPCIQLAQHNGKRACMHCHSPPTAYRDVIFVNIASAMQSINGASQKECWTVKVGIHYATFVHATKLHEQMLHGVCHLNVTCCIQIFLKTEDLITKVCQNS